MRTSALLVLALLMAGPALASEPPAEEETPAPRSLAEVEAPGFRAVEPFVVEEAPTVVLHGAQILTATGRVLEDGWIALQGGTIHSLGSGEPPELEGATVLDASGHWITPGLIDTHSHLGVYPSPGARAHGDGNEATAATTPGVWAEHSFWPQDPGLERATAGGVTALQILPGSANLIGGRGVVLQMVPHRGSRAMRFPGAPETVKLACGENPKRVYGDRGGPSTRMGNLRGVRSAFFAAQRAAKSWEDWEEKASKSSGKKSRKGGKSEPPAPPDRDLDSETLVGILRGSILPQVHCYRADDMLSMLQVADEFGFSIRSFHHALEAYKIRDILAERDVSVSTWADWWGFKLEAYDGIPQNAALVHDAGARAIIHSDSGIGIQRLNQEAGKALWSGRHAGLEISDDEALRWITLNPAWALGIDEVTGSLEAGKRADIAVWSGHPFSVYTETRWVFVAGVLRHDSQVDRLESDFQVGQGVTP